MELKILRVGLARLTIFWNTNKSREKKPHAHLLVKK